MSETKKMIIISIIAVLTLFIAVSGVSYAFINKKTNLKEEVSSVLVSGDEVSVVFKGKTEINGDYLKNNETINKIFTVKNTTTGAVNFNILWGYINNEYNYPESLSYSLQNSQGMFLKKDTQVPTTGSNIPIYKNISLEKNESETYTLTITYKEKKKNVYNQTLSAKIEVKSLNEENN